MNFHEILEAEGVEVSKRKDPLVGRGNIKDMTGKVIGRFRVTGIDEGPHSYSNVGWTCKCQDCGHVRVQRGDLLRKTTLQCPNCDPRPCRHKVTDWDARIKSLKRQMSCVLIVDTDDREIERVAAALAYAFRRKDGRK